MKEPALERRRCGRRRRAGAARCASSARPWRKKPARHDHRPDRQGADADAVEDRAPCSAPRSRPRVSACTPCARATSWPSSASARPPARTRRRVQRHRAPQGRGRGLRGNHPPRGGGWRRPRRAAPASHPRGRLGGADWIGFRPSDSATIRGGRGLSAGHRPVRSRRCRRRAGDVAGGGTQGAARKRKMLYQNRHKMVWRAIRIEIRLALQRLLRNFIPS